MAHRYVRRWEHRTELRTLVSGAQVEGPTATAAVLAHVRDSAIPEGRIAGAHRLAVAMEEYAQPNAPWQDQTGDARSGIHAFVLVEGNEVLAVLSHDLELDYPFWLENKDAGRFAIVLPTQELFAPKAGEIIAGEIVLELRGKGSKFRHKSSGRFS